MTEAWHRSAELQGRKLGVQAIRVGLTGAPMTSYLPPSTDIARSARDDLFRFTWRCEISFDQSPQEQLS
jgi:hypothetical protein